MPFPILVKILSGRPLGSLESRPHCLKISRNVPLEFLHFPLIFAQLKLTCLVTLFDIQNVDDARSFTMLNETFSLIFKHRARVGGWVTLWEKRPKFQYKREELL